MHSFLTLVLDEGESSSLCPAAFLLGRWPVLFISRRWMVDLKASLDVSGYLFTCPTFQTSIQLLSHYTGHYSCNTAIDLENSSNLVQFYNT
jgi:hypothetical protein